MDIGSHLQDDAPRHSRSLRGSGSPVRVLNLITRLSPGGGIPRVVRELLGHGDPARIQHHVCQIRPLHANDLDDQLRASAAFHSLEIQSPESRAGRVRERLLANARFMRVVREVRPHVVHVHTGTSLSGIAARLTYGRKVSWLLDFHEPLGVRHSRLTTEAVNGMVRSFGFSAVAHSSEVTRRVRDELGATVNLHRIPLGVDTSDYGQPAEQRSAWRERNGFARDAPLVVSVGRLEALKGAEELVEIARRVLAVRPATQFAIIGSGSLLAELSERVRSLGIGGRVRLLGFVDDLPSALGAADLFLTATRYEGFGIAAVEAAASGLPVVGTRIDGLMDVVVDGVTGLLVEADDLDGYAEMVVALLGDPDRLQRLGRNARERARKEFDIRVTVRRYEDLFEALARPRSVPEGH